MFYRLISIVGRGWASFAFLKMHLLKLSSILNLSYTSENKLLTKNQKNKNTCILLCTLLENSGRRHCKRNRRGWDNIADKELFERSQRKNTQQTYA